MALSDWTVEVFDVAPRKNSAANPYTGLPIDPDGITTSLVTMRLTHVPSGKVLDRADLFHDVTPQTLAHYARSIAELVDKQMSVQKTDATPSPLVGVLDIVPPPPAADTRTQAEKDLQVFQQAESAHAQKVALIAKLLDTPEGAKEAVSLQAEADKLKAVKDTAAVAVVAAEIAVQP